MPNEYDFMKSAKEKEMSDEEYKPIREQYDKAAAELSGKIRKAAIAFLVIFAVSFAVVYIYCFVRGKTGADLSYMWLASEFLLAIFLYDPRAEADKKQQYETDKKILLNAARSRITSYKIRYGLLIGFGIVFLLMNIIWWMSFGSVPGGEAPVSELSVSQVFVASVFYL